MAIEINKDIEYHKIFMQMIFLSWYFFKLNMMKSMIYKSITEQILSLSEDSQNRR